MSEKRKVDFVIVGAQKAGTSFLSDILRKIPDIYMPIGESSFFEKEFYSRNGLGGFLDQFKDIPKNHTIGIKRPSYLCLPESAELIKKDLNSPKVIAVLRNPVDRAISSYYHNVRYGFLPLCSIEEGIEKLLGGKLASKYKRSSEVIDFGVYSKNIKHYHELYGKQNVLVLIYEELKKDPLSALKEVLAFLNLDIDNINSIDLNSRVQVTEYNITLLRFLRLKNRFLFNYNKERTRLFEKEQTSIDKIACRVIDYLYYFFKSRLAKINHPRNNNLVRSRLWAFYLDDVKELKNIINNKIDWENH